MRKKTCGSPNDDIVIWAACPHQRLLAPLDGRGVGVGVGGGKGLGRVVVVAD
jgi:hypothetical protein